MHINRRSIRWPRYRYATNKL